jgi:hypothetical protein
MTVMTLPPVLFRASRIAPILAAWIAEQHRSPMRTTLDCAAVTGCFRLLTLYRRLAAECDAEPEFGVAPVGVRVVFLTEFTCSGYKAAFLRILAT